MSRRSASVGALPREKQHFVSRNESASGYSLDVRCACQYFESDSLLPERINPVDSRPGSKLGFHSDVSGGADLEQFHPMNAMQSLHRDDLSERSFEFVKHTDVERLSMHSQPPTVDLSFVEKYPELEQTARSRGLVVRSISDATEGDLLQAGSQSFLASQRRRQPSVGGLSGGSGRAVGGMRDMETLSMRSGTSLRRISVSNSKADLYVADINIPGGRDKQRDQRSVSMSRRTSNADLFQATIMPATQVANAPLTVVPQLNLIAATPNAAMSEQPPDFQRVRSRSPSQSATPDFRIAKPPLSVDYMRPNGNKENQPHSDMLPQNRPIDVTKFNGDAVRPSFFSETDYKNMQDTQTKPPTKSATAASQDPLQKTVAMLEEMAAHNIVEIRDNIQSESTRPPSILEGDLSVKSLHLAELTNINIVSTAPVVDIDALIQLETEKSQAKRAKSPPPRRPKSPPIVATLQLPSSRPSSPTQANDTPAAPQLKRQHTPERQLSPERANKVAGFTPVTHPAAKNGLITLQEASPEVKSSYATRFKSMFTSKPTESATPTTTTTTNTRQKSPSPLRQKSPSPMREKSPSPATGKLLSLFSKNKAQPLEIVSGGSAVVTKKQEAEPLSVKVTETFSLKVDDMDQYCTRPTKPLQPPAFAQTMYSSREDFAASERASADISDAFTPVVVSAVPRGGFMAGNRSFYSSEIDMPQLRGSELDFHGSSKEPSIGSRALISVPIDIAGSGRHIAKPPSLPPGAGLLDLSRSRAPSEQRFGRERKSSFREPRTQSHDRARMTASQEQLYATTARMTKTVSFNFDERKSRLTDFESNTPLTQKQKDHRDFLERTYFSREHEYEPIGVSPAGAVSSLSKESSPAPGALTQTQNGASSQQLHSMEYNIQQVHAEIKLDLEDDEPAISVNDLDEALPQEETRKRGFMATAQDRTRRMQDGLRNQAGKIRTKLRSQPKKPVSGSPKAKERRRFKAPEFSKLKMPEIKRPDMSKFTEIKRPDFTKFNKPDMSKFKLPEKFTTIKLGRSKSFKENEPTTLDDEHAVEKLETAPADTAQPAQTQRKLFDFSNFGTYPRAFRKKKKPEEPTQSSLATEGPSIVPTSTETQPSLESSSSPQGDRGPGPVRSRWADKFSDVSYNDSEGSRYRRYGSELESFDRESSLERRMKDDLEDTADTGDTGSEPAHHDIGILGGVADSKQFAEFDEENRAIHEISNLRSREFKRRPIVHQDSDLRSEDSKDAEGWTDKEIQKNKLLRKAEQEAEASYYKYRADDGVLQDAVSTASSGKKVVMEEIDDDEFFLRKRGISEDNIELRQYISEAIREGYDMPNALQQLGQASEEQMPYGEYDVPPPKPRRLHRNYRPEYGDSQEFQRSDYGDDYSVSQNGSDFLGSGAPKRPLRKGGSRSKYSVDSQDIPLADEGSAVQYFDDDEEYLRPPARSKDTGDGMNNLNFVGKEGDYAGERFDVDEEVPKPQAPRRLKKRGTLREGASLEKDSAAFINGFGGRSVSNTFLQPTEDVIVYRTEHEYRIPLATPERYTDTASGSTRKSRFDEDDHTSRGADSLDAQIKPEYNDEAIIEEVQHEKYVIDMMENDGYAVVRKEPVPKPTPPVRRKKFTRAPGERFATLPSVRTKRGSPPPERPPPPQGYTPSLDSPVPARPKSAASLDAKPNYEEEDDYEEPEALERPESPRNLQSGEIVNRMKFRPLPPPPRPPREKRQRGVSGGADDRYEGDSELQATSSTADSYEQNPDFEVEVSTQTDPLPDDFVCEEFEITEDMKVIEPRRTAATTLDDLLKATQQDEPDEPSQLTEDEQLARGLQRFRDANQRSLSERSRASSQADRSKSLSRPQTPSAIVIERRVSTPAPSPTEEATVEAALIVRPISAADLADDELRREEEELRREGLLSDSSVQSKSDVETAGEEEEQVGDSTDIVLSDYAPSSADLDAAVEKLQFSSDSKLYDEEVERTLRDSEYEEEDEGEKYSAHFDEDEQAEAATEDEYKLTEQELEAMEKELQEEMEKELQDMEKKLARSKRETSTEIEIPTPREAPSKEEADSQQLIVESSIVKETTTTHEIPPVYTASDEERNSEKYIAEEPIETPQPPPRRKSTTVIETPPTLTIAEQPTRELTPQRGVANVPEQTAQPAQLPSRLGDLEVERLRVHALQAGQIMVSQLHGTQISADELECKSGNLVVQNIELPPGFIEDIVERVRSTDHRAPLLTAETQTSRQPSSEPQAVESVSTAKDVEPPQKPPRQSKISESTVTSDAEHHSNLDEQTQTEAAMLPLPPPPAVYPSVEYLQSLAPLAFYNLQRSAEAEQTEQAERKATHKLRRRQLQRRQREAELATDELLEGGSDIEDQQLIERPRSRRSRTRSATQPPLSADEDEPPKTVVQAGRQFISACSLELVNIINQLTNYVRGGALEPNHTNELQARHIPALMVLFMIITFGLLVFLLTGRNVHTHHWDYFNPPGNEGRQT